MRVLLFISEAGEKEIGFDIMSYVVEAQAAPVVGDELDLDVIPKKYGPCFNFVVRVTKRTWHFESDGDQFYWSHYDNEEPSCSQLELWCDIEIINKRGPHKLLWNCDFCDDGMYDENGQCRECGTLAEDSIKPTES